MNDAKLDEDGLSLFDFELLAQKYGIFAETYELDWTEFTNLKINDYFVCLINNQNFLHYVIVKKHYRHLEIWDSLSGQYQTTYEEFAKLFTNVIIMVNKNKCKPNINKLNGIDLLKSIDIKYLCLNLFLQILVIGFSTIGANYLNIIINNAITPSSIKNALVISVMFIFIYICNGLSKYILNLYATKYFKSMFRYLSNELMKSLKHKQNNFFTKIDSSYFYLLDTSIYTITSFVVIEISSLCASLIMFLTVIVVIICINYWFLFIGLISIIISIIFGVVQYSFKSNIVKTTIENQNINNSITRDYISYLQTQNNSIVENALSNKLKTNYFEFLKIYSSKSKFDSGFEFFQNIIMNIIYTALVLLACYLIVNSKSLNIGQLTLLISLSSMLNTSINNICEFVIKRIEYKQMVGIYKDFINFANIENKGTIAVDDVKKIIYTNKKLILHIKNGMNITKHKRFILNLLTMNDSPNETKLSINGIDVKDFEYEKLSKKILIINYDTQISKEWILKKLNQDNTLFINALKEFKINLSSRRNIDIYERVLINILSLMLVTNKIICFNDCLKYISKKNLRYFNKNIIPYLKSRNFLMFVKS